MNITTKYNQYRASLRNGDIILFRGNDVIDWAIQKADDAYFNHIGIVWKVGQRFLTCDATAGRGVNIDFLSTRMKQEVDFCVLRSISQKQVYDSIWQLRIDNTLDKALMIGDAGYKYNYLFILQILLYKFIGKDFKKISNKKSFICSKFVQYYTDLLDIDEYKSELLITPQDYVRKMTENIEIVIDREYKF